MNPFVCLLDRSGATLEPGLLGRLVEPLGRHGGSCSTYSHGPLGIALLHDPEVLESRRQHGPLTDRRTGLVAALAGRFTPVHQDPAGGGPDPAAAGAELVLAAARRQDDGFPARLAGSFVLIAADPAGPWLSLVRDHLGSLKLYYYLDRRWLVAASEPEAVLRHGAVADELDERAAARFLGFQFTSGELSFFRQIRELPPAHRLRVTADESHIDRFWRFRRRARGESRAPEEVRASFRAHLRRSLGHQLADLEADRVALSLSGGLDSTALAALAPRRVRAFTWTFDEVPEGDERRRTAAVADHLGIRVREVRGDGCHPLSGDFGDRFVHAGSPYVNPFAALKERLYRAARAAGCRRVLVGDGGDALYAAREYWLRDTLTGGRPGAAASLRWAVRKALRGDRLARLALRRLLPLPALRQLRRGPRTPWLTAEARSRLPPQAFSPILPPGGARRRFELCAGTRHSELESEEARLFVQCGVDRGNPFWDWPLLQMVIGLPAWWHHRAGERKVLTRESMRGLLPDEVLDGDRGGLLGAFFLRGIELGRRDLRETVFRRPRSDWQRFVDRSWLEPYLTATDAIQFGHTILWRVISYELWQRRLAEGR